MNNLRTTTLDRLQHLVQDQIPESAGLEYKAKIPDGTSDAKREFLCDISAFSNTIGGTLIYGIDANKGVPTGFSPHVDDDIDSTILRLESLLRDGLDPRIDGISIEPIKINNGYVLLVHIPQSFSSPHRVSIRKHSGFYMRNSAGKYALDTFQIRNAMINSEQLPERIRRFHKDRVSSINSRSLPVQLPQRFTVVLHSIPYSSLRSNRRLFDAQAIKQHADKLNPLTSSTSQARYNVDGVITVHHETIIGGPRSLAGYCQGFRDGAIEAVSTYFSPDDSNRSRIPGTLLAYPLIKSIDSYRKLHTALDLGHPVSIQVSLLHAKNLILATNPRWTHSAKAIDRDRIELPDVLVTDPSERSDHTIRPILDALWNASGYESCLEYDEEGNWSNR